MSGRFITLDGGDGTGKTTQLAFIRNWLTEQNKTVVVTREPGGTRLGEVIRALLLDNELPAMAAETELLLIFAARAEHLTQVIRPALARGDWVLCDRFTDATYAYQGGGRGIAGERIAVLEQWVQQGLQPDLSLFLDLPTDKAADRVRNRGERNRFECEMTEFAERVRQGYLNRAVAEPERCRVIDAGQDRADVSRAIESHLMTLSV